MLISGLQEGNYTFTVTNGIGCTSPPSATAVIKDPDCGGNDRVAQDTTFVNNPKLNSTNKAALAIKVYPIPSQTNFTLKVQSKTNENVEINIYDVTGRKIQQLRGAAFDTYRFGDMYAVGAYLVEVLQGSNRVTQKILKQ